MRPPLVSVVMSVYNEAESHLKEAIDSILNQALRDFEFIIVDDGSTNGTPEVLKHFSRQDRRVKIITNPKNIGLTRSLNKAIKIAKGKYIARQDADDISLPERLKRQVEFMEKNSKVALLGTAFLEMSPQGEIIGQKTPPTSNSELQRVLIKYNPFLHSSVLMRKEALAVVGPYDESFLRAQDYELWFRIAQKYQIANLTQALIIKRYSQKMISLAKEREQIFWAQKARTRALARNQYPQWCSIYLWRPFVVSLLPAGWRRFLRRYFLKRKIYG